MNVLEEMTIKHGEANAYRIDHSYTEGLTDTEEQAIQKMLDMLVASINYYLNPKLKDFEKLMSKSKEIH